LSQESSSFRKPEVDRLIILILEKLSQVFRSLLWDNAKQMQLSPIQIQFLVHIGSHSKKYSSVSEIARAFKLTAPTVSDAIKTLETKGLIQKIISPRDRRRFPIALTRKGLEITEKLSSWYEPLLIHLPESSDKNRESVLLYLFQFMDSLKNKKLINGINPCLSCNFFRDKNNVGNDEEFYCTLRKVSLKTGELQLNCPNYTSGKSDN
jgi:DNA-binding MarR family transcriptional regulator